MKDLKSEYDEVVGNEICKIPLIQATKVIGLEEGDLPVIKTNVEWLERNFKWLEEERKKGTYVYGLHIKDAEDQLIDSYPKLKIKLKKNFNSKTFKNKKVCAFVNSAIILELNHMIDRLGDRPAFLSPLERETLH